MTSQTFVKFREPDKLRQFAFDDNCSASNVRVAAGTDPKVNMQIASSISCESTSPLAAYTPLLTRQTPAVPS